MNPGMLVGDGRLERSVQERVCRDIWVRLGSLAISQYDTLLGFDVQGAVELRVWSGPGVTVLNGIWGRTYLIPEGGAS